MVRTKEEQAKYMKAWRARKKLDPEYQARENEKDLEYSRRPEVKDFRRAYLKAWRAENKGHIKDHAAALRDQGYFIQRRARLKAHDPDRVRLQEHRWRIQRLYGIRYEQYEALCAAQGGVCAVCRQPETQQMRGKVMMLAVDHDRRCCPKKGSCGKCVRALLCARCNMVLGQVNDSPELLAQLSAYIETSSPLAGDRRAAIRP